MCRRMSTTIDPASTPKRVFERAVRHHVAGRLDEAAQLYREAIAMAPDFAEACNNLGAILGERGETARALSLAERATRIKPDYGEAHHNVGLLLTRLGRHGDAFPAFIAACQADPSRADWANSLGNNCVELSRFAEGLVAFDRAVTLAPNEAEFWNNRSLALRGLGRTVEALASLEESLALNPQGTNALSNLGVMLREERRLPEAIAVFERATAAAPHHAPTLANFASVYELMGDHARVRELAERARALDPGFAEPLVLLANCALEEGKYDESLSLLRECLAMDPDNRNANWNLAILQLLRGDFGRGWRQFESRKALHAAVIDGSSYNAPEWDGSQLNGGTLLVHTEQGAGDAIQFIRLVRQLRDKGAGKVVLECPFPIAPLLSGVEGVDQVIARGEQRPPYDAHVLLMSLPYLLGLRLDTIPARVPYIPVERRPVASLVDAPPSILRIGVVWAGNPMHHRDRLRSIPLQAFAPLFAIPGTAWYALQKGDASLAHAGAIPGARVTDLGPHLNDFRDTAAVLERLDLVISVDTSVAHLAGALGRPTWTLLTHVPDFRWMLDRQDTPWYPTMRLFRQPEPHAWAPVLAAVESELRELVKTRATSHAGTSQHQDVHADTEVGVDVPIARPSGIAPSDEPTTLLESATRLEDGRPRFDLWVPIAALNEPTAFAAYEAELVGGGYDRALRDFWDDALGVVDTFVDLAPGLGLSLFSALTASAPAAAIAVEPDERAAERLRQLARARGIGERLQVVAAFNPSTATRQLGVRCASASRLRELFTECEREGARDRLSIVTVTGVAPNEIREALCAWAAHGYTAFQVTRPDGEVSLDPVVDWEGQQDLAVLSADALNTLTRRASQRHVARPHDASGAVAAVHGSGASPAIGIDWELRPDTGWGVYGTNLAVELSRRGDVAPWVFAADLSDAAAFDRWQLQRLIVSHLPPSRQFEGLMLHALGNNLAHGPLWDRLRGQRNVGVIFFEDTSFDDAARDTARALDLIVAGSNWNGEVLRALGVSNVQVIQQGVDATIFHPAPASGRMADRFVVFSGGKLEYRKGQDLVVAAFRRFRERHPESVLVTAWHNPWPHLITDLDRAGHVSGVPAARDGVMDVTSWLAANGIPRDAVIDIGRVPNEAMGRVIREANVAVFPNRCEGGTNLVAMECMAVGIPTVVSNNTGHTDLVATGGCIPLQRQGAVRPPTRFFRACDGWGESEVDEIVQALETAYTGTVHAVAQRGATAMQGWSWRAQTNRLVDVLSPLLH